MQKTTSLQIMALGLLVAIHCTLIGGIAASEWYVKAPEIIQFDVQVKTGGVTQVAGLLEIRLYSNASAGLNYSIVCDFTIDEMGYTTLLNSTPQLTTGENVSILSGIPLLYSKTSMDAIVAVHTTTYKTLEDAYYAQYLGNTSVRYSLKSLSYGYELKFQDEANAINTYEKKQYSAKGVLTYYEVSSLSVDNKESGLRIKQTAHLGAPKGIPGYSGVMLGGILVVTLAMLAKCARRPSRQ